MVEHEARETHHDRDRDHDYHHYHSHHHHHHHHQHHHSYRSRELAKQICAMLQLVGFKQFTSLLILIFPLRSDYASRRCHHGQRIGPTPPWSQQTICGARSPARLPRQAYAQVGQGVRQSNTLIERTPRVLSAITAHVTGMAEAQTAATATQRCWWWPVALARQGTRLCQHSTPQVLRQMWSHASRA